VSGIVIQDVREDTLVATIIDNGQNAEGAIIQFIGGQHNPKKSAKAQSRKSVSIRACAFFSPRLDPVLDRGKGTKTRCRVLALTIALAQLRTRTVPIWQPSCKPATPNRSWIDLVAAGWWIDRYEHCRHLCGSWHL